MNEKKNNRKEKDLVYLLALLHNIGKFWRRADDGDFEKSKYLNTEEKAYLKTLFVSNEVVIKNLHVLWTVAFVRKYKHIFGNLLSDSGLTLEDFIQIAADHHLPYKAQTALGQILKEATSLSSGLDREDEDSIEDYSEEKTHNVASNQRLKPIFECLLTEKTSNLYSYPISKITLDRSSFPKEKCIEESNYRQLWDDFELEFGYIHANSIKSFSETLLSLLYKYTCNVPISFNSMQEVSLYDHLKTTASIAVSLYEWELSGENDQAPLLLIGADFSGIQTYIYNIASKNAAKNLKGRSFYLKLLSDSVISYVIDRLELFKANVVYNAGGSFYLLTANTESNKRLLEQAIQVIEEKIFETHGTSIYVAIDSVQLSKSALMGVDNESLSYVWGALFDLRNKKKKNRYAQRLRLDYDYFFEPGEVGGSAIRDAITGEELTTEEEKKGYTFDAYLDNEDAKKPLKEITYKQIQLGRNLRDAECWVVSQQPLSFLPKDKSINPANLGYYYYFLTRKELDKNAKQLNEYGETIKVVAINSNEKFECELLIHSIQNANIIHDFDFFGGNNYPRDDKGDPLLFDEFAGEASFKRLGILRMDVDNLGLVFQKGFKGRKNSLSHLSAVSRGLDWFFKGYLNTIWSKYSSTTNIIYSGGDDLFIIGKWNDVVDLALDIKKEFKEYVCNNPNLSLSGGVAIVPTKFPIKKAAEESEDTEKLAKNHTVQGKDKNAFTILGIPLNWDLEFSDVMEIKNKILGVLRTNKLPQSFIGKLNMHYKQGDVLAGKYVIKPRIKWLMAYDFARLNQRLNDSFTKELIDTCKNDIFCNTLLGKPMKSEYHPLELWYLAARWAELENRSEIN